MTKRKAPEDILPAGRPTSYEPWMDSRALELMKAGHPKFSVAAEFNISDATMYNWLDPDHASFQPTFLDAIKAGENHLKRWWTEKGMDAIQGNVDKFPSSAWIFAMKNISKWVDKTEVAQTVDASVKIVGLPGVNIDDV